jgi:hypothetical protein
VTETEPAGKTYQQWMSAQVDALAQALGLESGEQIIGADRLAGGGDERVDLAAQLREGQAVLGGVGVGAGKASV